MLMWAAPYSLAQPPKSAQDGRHLGRAPASSVDRRFTPVPAEPRTQRWINYIKDTTGGARTVVSSGLENLRILHRSLELHSMGFDPVVSRG